MTHDSHELSKISLIGLHFVCSGSNAGLMEMEYNFTVSGTRACRLFPLIMMFKELSVARKIKIPLKFYDAKHSLLFSAHHQQPRGQLILFIGIFHCYVDLRRTKKEKG